MELWTRTGPHRVQISDSEVGWNPEILDTWINHAIRAIISIDSAIRALDANADPHLR